MSSETGCCGGSIRFSAMSHNDPKHSRGQRPCRCLGLSLHNHSKVFDIMKQALIRAALVCSLIVGVLVTAQAASAAMVVSVAPVPPPPPPRVVVAPAPGGGFVWVAGFYQWNGRAYVWLPGRWVRPPYPHAVWVPATVTYVPARHGYVFVAGYWRR